MSIDYENEGGGLFHAPVMRIADAGHGFVGVVYDAATRQAKDYETDKLKWWHNRKVIVTDDPPADAEWSPGDPAEKANGGRDAA